MSLPEHASPQSAAAQAGGFVDPVTAAVVPPIHPASTYERDASNRLISGRLYSRADNPTYDLAEQLISRLESGASTLLFSSGMSAACAAFLALNPGDRVLVPKVIYWALRNWLVGWASNWGLKVTSVDMTDLGAVREALRQGGVKLVWIETPANPSLDITDIAAVAALAHGAGARLAVDSTFATPVHTQPLKLGADLVMHSATKYLNGHSDVIAGSLTTCIQDDYWARVRSVRVQFGSVLGPFEAWLLLRGMRTLFARVPAQSRSALQIAQHFQGDRRLKAVLYPGLEGFAGHEIARSQMKDGFGGMISLRVAGGPEKALQFIGRLSLWRRATSLGGVESLVEHRASVEGPESSTPGDLLRMSVGLEACEDLKADIEQALG